MVAAVRVHKHGGPEVLTYEDVEVPAPGPGQARVKNHACGLNYIDTYFRSGLYPSAGGLPFVAGNEGAGEVVAVGPGVTEVKVGDRVGYTSALGSYAAERIMPADRLVKLPDNISYEQAAGMMLKGMTVEYLHAPDLQGAEGHERAHPCRRRRHRPHRLPVGELSRRQRDRHRRLEGQGGARQGQRLPPHHPLSRGGLPDQGQGDHRRQAVRGRL